MFESVLVVCTGNICRSPMAEALLATRIRSRGLSTRVASAGVRALVGAAPDPIAVELMRARRIDIGAHRARQLTPALLGSFDLVLVMDSEQQRAIEGRYPASRGRVHRLGRRGRFDVPDPFRRGREAFTRSLELIERGLDEIGALLCDRA